MFDHRGVTSPGPSHGRTLTPAVSRSTEHRERESGGVMYFVCFRNSTERTQKCPPQRPEWHAGGCAVAGDGSVFGGYGSVKHHQKWRCDGIGRFRLLWRWVALGWRVGDPLELVSELGLFGFEVAAVVFARFDAERDLFDDLQAVAVDAVNL